MIAKVTYFGFYPLGTDVSLRNTRIMQEKWNRCTVPVFVIGKKNVVNPTFGEVYYIKNDGQAVFFCCNRIWTRTLSYFYIQREIAGKTKQKDQKLLIYQWYNPGASAV